MSKSSLSLFLAFFLLSGCGGSEEKGETNTTEVSFSGTIIPLYSYPGEAAWDLILEEGNSTIETIAIINPSNGPVECNTTTANDYALGIAKLRGGAVRVIGYVYTSYGARNIAEVKNDVDRYYECFDGMGGIFFDETNQSSEAAGYYGDLSHYVREINGSNRVVLNPGIYPDEAIVQSADTVIIYEEGGVDFDHLSPPSYVQNYSPQRFALLGYGVSASAVNRDKLRGVSDHRVGYLYLTDDTLDNPWDTLGSYYETFKTLLR